MVKIASVNTRGLAHDKKRRVLFKMSRDRSDITFLQETHSTENDEKIWESEWGGQIVFSHGTNQARGVCILLDKKLDYKILSIDKINNDGRCIIIEIKVNEIILVLCNVYAPNRDTPHFFHEIAAKLMHFPENKIILGDFNLTLDVNLDRLNTYHNNSNSQLVLEQMIQDFNLEDVWRCRNENVRSYTWFKTSDKNEPKASRIDFALTDRGLDVENVTFFPVSFTDHHAVFLSIKTIKGQERGSGYWKFNNLLLQDPEFLLFMNSKLENTLKDLTCPTAYWIELKKNIAAWCKKYSREKKQMENLAISQLLEIIAEYQQDFPLNEKQYDIYEKSMIDLEELQLNYIQGVMFRTKAKWTEEGEKNTKYFLGLEKSRYNSVTM